VINYTDYVEESKRGGSRALPPPVRVKNVAPAAAKKKSKKANTQKAASVTHKHSFYNHAPTNPSIGKRAPVYSPTHQDSSDSSDSDRSDDEVTVVKVLASPQPVADRKPRAANRKPPAANQKQSAVARKNVASKPAMKKAPAPPAAAAHKKPVTKKAPPAVARQPVGVTKKAPPMGSPAESSIQSLKVSVDNIILQAECAAEWSEFSADWSKRTYENLSRMDSRMDDRSQESMADLKLCIDSIVQSQSDRSSEELNRCTENLSTTLAGLRTSMELASECQNQDMLRLETRFATTAEKIEKDIEGAVVKVAEIVKKTENKFEKAHHPEVQ
jgi:hypothetical protein